MKETKWDVFSKGKLEAFVVPQFLERTKKWIWKNRLIIFF